MASKTAALLMLLAIFGSTVANVAQASSFLQSNRKLLTTTQTVTWGAHHSGEVCYGDGLAGLLQAVLGEIKVYVNADLSIACIDLLWADVSLLSGGSLIKAFIDLPLHPSTDCSLLGLNADVSLKLNQGLVGGLLSTILGLVEKVVSLVGIVGDNGQGPLLYIKIGTSTGQSHEWGDASADGLKLNLDISNLLGLSTCRSGGAVSLLNLSVNV